MFRLPNPQMITPMDLDQASFFSRKLPMSIKKRVVIIAPCFNEEAVLEKFHGELTLAIDACSAYEFHFLYVDDGSRDRTPEILANLSQLDDRVGYVSLSRNFGHQVALSAGIDHCGEADAAILMDCDLQHPPAMIPRLLDAWDQGAHDIVSCRRVTTEAGWIKRICSEAFYRFFNLLSDTRIEPNVADFGLLGRPVLDALKAMPERHRFLRGMISWTGFRRTYIDFQAPPRAAGESKYSWGKMLSLGLTAVYSFSPQPLRIAIRLGTLLTLLGMCYLLFIIWSVFYTPEKIQAGWPSVIAVVLIMSGVNLLFTGLVGEYVARIYEEAKSRPLYLVRQSRLPRIDPRPAPQTDPESL